MRGFVYLSPPKMEILSRNERFGGFVAQNAFFRSPPRIFRCFSPIFGTPPPLFPLFSHFLTLQFHFSMLSFIFPNEKSSIKVGGGGRGGGAINNGRPTERGGGEGD